MRTMTSVYNDGITAFIQCMNQATDYRSTNVFFSSTHRDCHIASRAVERKLDMVGILTEAGKLLKANVAQVVEAMNSKRPGLTVQTIYGNMAFRCFWNSRREGFELKLCTVTPVTFAHDRDFILK